MAKEKKAATPEVALVDLPPLTLEEAAWLLGITPEALEGFMASADLAWDRKTGTVAPLTLMRGVFSLLSQREAQLEMLRIQLSSDAVVHQVAHQLERSSATGTGTGTAVAETPPESAGKGKKAAKMKKKKKK